MSSPPVVVIGAGPAGLATAACLGRRGVEAIVLEAAPALGASWRRHYDRLRLHTVKQRSHLPGMPFGDEVPRYPSRADVVAYLEAYAARFGVAPRTGERARRVRADGETVVVETERATHAARAVVIATGANLVPNPARLPGQEQFRGTLMHAATYRDGAPFAGRRVLVVGAGNTGAELALDLAQRGAHPTLAVRSPVNVVPRDFLGVPTQLTSIRLAKTSLRFADACARLVSRLAFGDLTRYGFARPDLGALSAIAKRRRIPILDSGTIAAVKRGEIAVKPGVERLTEHGAAFVDGTMDLFDVAVLATGYRPALEELVDVPGALGADGFPIEGGRPRVFFVGYHVVATGMLREIAAEAERVAAAVSGVA